jgi:hypothetical protein
MRGETLYLFGLYRHDRDILPISNCLFKTAMISDTYFPPTPAPSLPSPSTTQEETHKVDHESYPHYSAPPTHKVEHKSFPHYSAPPTAPPMYPLPLTPPEEEELQRLKLSDAPEGIERIRRGRTPIVTELGSSTRTSSTTEQALDVDLEGDSSGEFDESREPTLSFHTSSTVESTTGTPSSTHHNYNFGSSGPREKDQRVRIRSTNGRATAYSSAESSGAYSYHQYENHVFHPHPPPLPDRPVAHASPIGLGYPVRDAVTDDQEADAEDEADVEDAEAENGEVEDEQEQAAAPASFAYRPWESEDVNRQRSHSGASMTSTTSSQGQGSSLQHYDYHYPESLPWDTQRELENDSQAVAMVEEGREKTLDMAYLQELGGMGAMTDKKIAALSGTFCVTRLCYVC